MWLLITGYKHVSLFLQRCGYKGPYQNRNWYSVHQDRIWIVSGTLHLYPAFYIYRRHVKKMIKNHVAAYTILLIKFQNRISLKNKVVRESIRKYPANTYAVLYVYIKIYFAWSTNIFLVGISKHGTIFKLSAVQIMFRKTKKVLLREETKNIPVGLDLCIHNFKLCK